MSRCVSCKYALHDGMCLAKGKFTLLDAPACAEYVPTSDVTISRLTAENMRLTAENARMRNLVRDTSYYALNLAMLADIFFESGSSHYDEAKASINRQLAEFGMEVPS